MAEQAEFQDGIISVSDPNSIISFDFQTIAETKKPLIHKAARFWYIRSGRGTLILDGKEYQLIPYTLVSVTPWTISEIPVVEEPLQFIRIVYDFQFMNSLIKHGPVNEQEGSEILRVLSEDPVCYLDPYETDRIDEIAASMRMELGVDSAKEAGPKYPMSLTMATLRLVELMLYFIRYRKSAKGDKKEIEKRISQRDSILSYIYAHSSEKLTLGRVAEAFYLSESGLARRLRESTGTSFIKLLTAIRIDRASEFLIYTSLTLSEIAEMVGFVDASHLSKHFVAKVGITPNSYRTIYGRSRSKLRHSDRETAYAATDFIHRNYMKEDMSSSTVAAEFGVTVQELNRLLTYYAGMNYETLVNFIRVNRACELLVTTDSLITNIAYEVGYRNVKTFNLNFLRYKEMTPTEFRSKVDLQNADGTVVSGAKKRKRTHRKEKQEE